MINSHMIEVIKLATPTSMEYSIDIENPKEKKKFIERVKRIVRGSKEYKDYIRFLKDNMNMNQCAFFSGIKQSRDVRVSIEVHHEPFTLEEIIRTVMNKQMDEGKPLCDLDIADEVVELHYNNMIGLIPLSKTIHEVIHNSDKITIPITLCYGDFRGFVSQYEDYIEDDILSKLERKIKETKELTTQSFNALEPKYEYIEVEGFQLPQKIAVEKEEIA